MSATQRKPMTVAEFLDWEEQQELRWEFDGFEPVAMAGGTEQSAAIQRNLNGQLYADAFVVCSPVAPKATVVAEPVVVFEILSPSTAFIDRGVKNEEYRDTPSIVRYVMLEQDRQAATVFTRVGDDWVGHIRSGDAVLNMPEIGIDLPLADIYEDITFDETGMG